MCKKSFFRGMPLLLILAMKVAIDLILYGNFYRNSKWGISLPIPLKGDEIRRLYFCIGIERSS